MKRIILLLCLVLIVCQIYALEVGDAVYRDGTYWFLIHGHAGIWAGNNMVYETQGPGCHVELNTFDAFLAGQDFWGGRFNPIMTSTDRNNIIDKADELVEAGEDIGYCFWNALQYTANPGQYIDVDEITEIRCDGIVEYCYEWNWIPVWAISDNGQYGNPDLTRYDICDPAYVEEHNNVGSNQPWFELSPKVQCGGSGFHWTQLTSVSTSVDDFHIEKIQSNISNYPNPFNPTTVISYSLGENIQNPKIEIYNVKGQKVKSFQLEDKAGENSIVWNGKDTNDKPVSSGVYFYRLINEGKTVQSRKMLLMK